jgi:4'-phosphopantetheinyl transferase
MDLGWDTSTPRPLLAGEVHVWRASLRPGSLGAGDDGSLLSPEEETRAGSFRATEDTDRFIIARATLRRLLGTYLDEAPERVVIHETPSGKPRVARTGRHPDVRFNLAHAGALGLFAFALGLEVGVDCETQASSRGIDAVLAKAATADERKSLDALPADRRAKEGLRLWTRKEAILKGLGTGLSLAPESLEVGVSPRSAPPQRITVRGQPWLLFDLPGLPEAFGSLAVDARAVSLHTWEWVRR